MPLEHYNSDRSMFDPPLTMCDRYCIASFTVGVLIGVVIAFMVLM